MTSGPTNRLRPGSMNALYWHVGSKKIGAAKRTGRAVAKGQGSQLTTGEGFAAKRKSRAAKAAKSAVKATTGIRSSSSAPKKKAGGIRKRRTVRRGVSGVGGAAVPPERGM